MFYQYISHILFLSFNFFTIHKLTFHTPYHYYTYSYKHNLEKITCNYFYLLQLSCLKHSTLKYHIQWPHLLSIYSIFCSINGCLTKSTIKRIKWAPLCFNNHSPHSTLDPYDELKTIFIFIFFFFHNKTNIFFCFIIIKLFMERDQCIHFAVQV